MISVAKENQMSQISLNTFVWLIALPIAASCAIGTGIRAWHSNALMLMAYVDGAIAFAEMFVLMLLLRLFCWRR